MVDPMNGESHEMLYNHEFKKWFVPGTDIVCTYNAEEPVIKQIDGWDGDIPKTIKRFPSNPLE